MRSNDDLRGKKSTTKRQAQSTKEVKQEISEAEDLYDDISGTFLVRYMISEKGIGQISLPPSLSMILQSDRISVSPSSGGLFIRSI